MASYFEDHCWQDVVTPGALRIYSHYERETYVGKNPALLAIDLYKLAYLGGPKPVEELIDTYPSACGEFAWNAIPPTERLFKAARAVGIPIIYSTAETRTEARADPKFGHPYSTNRQTVPRNPDVWEIKEEFAPMEGDLVVYKQRASAFFGTPLISELNRMGVDSLIVCGESTSGCVRATVVDGYSTGIHTTIAEECVFDRHELSHKVNLFDLHHKYADVMHTDEIVQHLYSTAGLIEAA
jgi:maleamate amidohydrolase